jgi:transcription antitermination protein NusB
MLYLWEVGRVQPQTAVELYWEMTDGDEDEPDLADTGRAFAERLVHGVASSIADLDAVIERHAQNWRLVRMAVIDRLILRLAAYELLHEPETPASVAIDEALELARTFSEEDAVRFVNGILDAIHKHGHD